MRTYQGPNDDPARGSEMAQTPLVLGADLEVVVDRRHVAVEEESGIGGVGLHERQQLVHELDQPQLEGAEG